MVSTRGGKTTAPGGHVTDSSDDEVETRPRAAPRSAGGRGVALDVSGSYGIIYKVILDASHYGRNGRLRLPGEGEAWLADCEQLDDDDAAALLKKYPLIGELIDVTRAACRPYKDDDPRAGLGKDCTHGSSFIYLTFRADENGVLAAYWGQKKVWICATTCYPGNPRARCVAESLFDRTGDIFSLYLECVTGASSFEAEGAAYFAGKMFLVGRGLSHLCIQMPMRRVPFSGLDGVLRREIEMYRRDHPARALLTLPPGAEIPKRVYQLGRMEPEAAAEHLEATNAGLAANGHGSLGEIGWQPGQSGNEATQFQPGKSGNEATQFQPGKSGNEATQFRPGHDNYSNENFLATKRSSSFLSILNAGIHCARTGEAVPAWLADLRRNLSRAAPTLRRLEFVGSLTDGEREERFKICGVVDNGGVSPDAFLVALKTADGEVIHRKPYYVCVALGLIDAMQVPPTQPGYGEWRAKLFPWPALLEVKTKKKTSKKKTSKKRKKDDVDEGPYGVDPEPDDCDDDREAPEIDAYDVLHEFDCVCLEATSEPPAAVVDALMGCTFLDTQAKVEFTICDVSYDYTRDDYDDQKLRLFVEYRPAHLERWSKKDCHESQYVNLLTWSTWVDDGLSAEPSKKKARRK